MGFTKTILLASAFALSAFSAPLPDCEPDAATNAASLTAANIVAIAPTTASCSGAEFPDECADASQAAVAISQSFETYKITTPGEQAALVAYMLYESGDFKYKINHWPGTPGQGTRMMASPDFVKKYATSVVGASAVTAAAGVEAVLALVNSDDEKSFGSAAWFLTSQCTADVRAGLVAETVDGWHTFLTACVGTTATSDRDVPWVAAKQVILG